MKDLVEEALFERRRDLFADMSVVFLDTTSLSFEGAGGKTMGARGHSKDHRRPKGLRSDSRRERGQKAAAAPDLNQMILGVVVDGEGRPVCTEMGPGNTADGRVLVPIIDRLRQRFGIGRVCVVADRGMISEGTIDALEERGLEYVLGVRERNDRRVRAVVLDDQKPFTPLLIERAKGETQLFVKEVKVTPSDGDRRYIVCRNEAEAAKDKALRQAIIQGLEAQLKKGDKALIPPGPPTSEARRGGGNSAYRRSLRKVAGADGTTGRAFEIDPGKLADEARFDGLFVLRTNARITPLQAVLRYRDLLQAEQLFRTAKALMRTRPIYYASDAAIRLSPRSAPSPRHDADFPR